MQNEFSMNAEVTLVAPVTKTAIEWAKEMGINWETVKRRRYRGWAWEQALSPRRRRLPIMEKNA
ncbi:hypothetical protein [Pseudomonas sp. LRF_L74]|uniref:hypothetical protein n=1 Tax=Pseudomonas sp. LRF_L74 TaxID=3369422 RepID=UPI003F5DDF6B